MKIVLLIFLIIIAAIVGFIYIVLLLKLIKGLIEFIKFIFHNIGVFLLFFVPFTIAIVCEFFIPKSITINRIVSISAFIAICGFLYLLLTFVHWMDNKSGDRWRSSIPQNNSELNSEILEHENIIHKTKRLQHLITEDDYGNEAYINDRDNIVEDELGNKLYDIDAIGLDYVRDTEGHYHDRY